MTGTDQVTGTYLSSQPLPVTWERWVHCDSNMTTVRLGGKKRLATIERVISDYKSHPVKHAKEMEMGCIP